MGTILIVDPLIYGNTQNWPYLPSYEYLETYQGVHPWKREHVQPHNYYPLCIIYEHITSIALATIMLQIDSSILLKEVTTVNDFQWLLIEASPRLMYVLPQRTATELLQPPNSIHSSSSSSSSGSNGSSSSGSSSSSSNVVLTASAAVINQGSKFVIQ